MQTQHAEPLSAQDLTNLLSLPAEALVKPREAAEILRLKCATLSWYRCNGGGPPYVKVGPKAIRYRMGDLRAYAKTAG
jgi:hypothetical protein